MALASTVNHEDFQNLFTDFTPLGLVTTERPNTHGLICQVENIRVEPQQPVQQTLENSSEPPSMENVTPNATASDRKRARGHEKSEADIAIAQARKEARLANEEKRVAAMALARAELATAKIAVVNLKKDNEDLTADIQGTMKQIDELTKQNKSLTKSVEDRIEELTRDTPLMDGCVHPDTIDLINFCNSILERME